MNSDIFDRMLKENDDDNCDFTWSGSKRTALHVIPMFGAVCSLIGSSFIIFSYLYFPRLRKVLTLQLIALMSSADFVASFARFLINPADKTCDVTPLCMAQAVLSQYAETAGFFWIFSLSLHFFFVLHVYNGIVPKAKQQKLTILYHCISWGLPAILLFFAIATDVLGYAGQWCWIKKSHQGAMIALYYGWLILIIFAILGMNTVLVSSFNKGNPHRTRAKNHLAFRLRIYLAAFIATHSFSIINRFQNIFDPDNPVFTLYLLQSLCGPFTGLINAAVFGFNKLVINEWKHLFNGASFQSGVPLHTDSTMRHVLLTEDDDYDVEKSTGVGQPDDDNMDNKAIAGGSYNTPVIATTEDHRLG